MKHLLIIISCILPFTINAQWNLIYNHSDQELKMSVINQDTIILVTNQGGRIHHSYNGGQHWSSYQTIFTSTWFLDVHFPTPTIGYACGGTAFGLHRNVIVKTIDGGLTWDSLTANAFTGYEFSSIHFVNKDTGFVSSTWTFGELLKTTNGGQSFSIINIPGIEIITEVYFPSPGFGFVSGYTYLNSSSKYVYLILRSTDLGASWTEVYADTMASSNNGRINSFFFLNDSIGYAVGNNGLFLKSTDSGSNWLSTYIAPNTNITSVHFVSKNVGYINNAGGIYVTTNGGSSWTVQQLNPLTIVRQISFANDSVGFALGDFGIYKTTNGGGSTVGIKEKRLKEKIQVFPNPATKDLHLGKPNDIFVEKVVLFDMSGKQVGQFNPRSIKFDISNFPAGYYFLKIKTNEGVQVNKIVVLPK